MLTFLRDYIDSSYSKNLSFALYCIVANIAKLIGAVDLLLANSASKGAEERFQTVKQLLELLAGAVEGLL